MSDLVAALRARGLDYLLLFVGFFSLLVYIQYNQVLGDPDGFYHAAMAEILSRGVILREMPWMQATTLRDSFTDHHFLYHVLLVPFVKLGNPLLGVKLATAVFGAAFFTVLYWTLRRLQGLLPLAMTLLLFFSSGFLFRLSLVKANSVSLILLCLILVAMFERKWWLLGFLNALYVWLYGGWFLGIVIAAVYYMTGVVYQLVLTRGLSAHSIFNRIRFRHSQLAVPLLVSVTGAAIGLIANPYWPQNLGFYWQQVWQIAIVNQGSTVNVGGEWSGMSWYDFLDNLSFTAFAGAAVLGVIVSRAKHLTHRSWTSIALMIIFSVFMMKSRRYIELAAPLMVIAASIVLADAFRTNLLRELLHGVLTRHSVRSGVRAIFVGLLIVLSIMPQFGLIDRIKKVQSEISGGTPLQRYQPVAEWLSANTLPGSVIMHSDWDDWPMLFYHNRRNYYLVGLDPTFMYNHDAALYEDWAKLTADGAVDDLSDLVSGRLGARYVLIEKDHVALQQVVASNIYFRLVYEDPETWVYRSVPPQRL